MDDYGETKVYFDGSHFIAIPHTTRPNILKRPKHNEELVDVIPTTENENTQPEDCVLSSCPEVEQSTEITTKEEPKQTEQISSIVPKKTTRKEIFDTLYKENISLPHKELRNVLVEGLLPYFRLREYAEDYVDNQLDRIHRNMICRRTRMFRKANLQEFNYFCTFTYDDEKHDEESFKKKLRACFRNLCFRKGWKYIGVWERSPEKHRLHFHGIFYIPNGEMVGEIIEVEDYSFKTHERQITHQNTFFNKRFGRSDFEEICEQKDKNEALLYLIKYLEKSGERIVYSKGLPQYFISDIMGEDIICPIGMEDKKLLLYDDFTCWDEGCLMGKVSKEVIKQMRKAN